MSKRESFARYHLIISTLRKKPVDFRSIYNYLERESEIQEYNFRISKRTFQRDLEDIRCLFNIDIQYDFSKKIYFISYPENSDANNRMLEAFDILQALNISDGLSKYIHLEKRRPQGTENLQRLLHAIKNNLRIKFNYQKFWEDKVSKRTAEPYALKEFNNRWYVVAKDNQDDHVKSFALDRLKDLEITNKRFKIPVNYDIEESYRYSFGIINPVIGEPEEIILSFDTFQGKYIKTLPLHHTQEIFIDNECELQIKLKLYITHDLVMELLSFGNSMTVVKPDYLVRKIKSEHKRAFEQYL